MIQGESDRTPTSHFRGAFRSRAFELLRPDSRGANGALTAEFVKTW